MTFLEEPQKKSVINHSIPSPELPPTFFLYFIFAGPEAEMPDKEASFMPIPLQGCVFVGWVSHGQFLLQSPARGT